VIGIVRRKKGFVLGKSEVRCDPLVGPPRAITRLSYRKTGFSPSSPVVDLDCDWINGHAVGDHETQQYAQVIYEQRSNEIAE